MRESIEATRTIDHTMVKWWESSSKKEVEMARSIKCEDFESRRARYASGARQMSPSHLQLMRAALPGIEQPMGAFDARTIDDDTLVAKGIASAIAMEHLTRRVGVSHDVQRKSLEMVGRILVGDALVNVSE